MLEYALNRSWLYLTRHGLMSVLSEKIILIRIKPLMDFLAPLFLSPLSELSTGLLTFAQFGQKDAEAKV